MAEAMQAWTDAEKVILNHGLEQQLLIQKDRTLPPDHREGWPDSVGRSHTPRRSHSQSAPGDGKILSETSPVKPLLTIPNVPQVDREKQKIKKAREGAGEVIESTPKTTPKTKGKRKAEGETETPASSAKKAKGRKKARDEDKKNGRGGDLEVVKADKGEIKTEAEEEGLS
jgi:hypothetical protein